MIIIFLISIGIAAFILIPMLGEGEDASERAACKTSVDLASKAKGPLGSSLIDNLNCKTQYGEIDELNEEKLYEEIALRMYDCWYQFGEGKRDFLSNLDPGGSDEWCFICSRIDFSEDVQDKYPTIKLENFHQFLKSKQIPFSNRYQTFYEYLFGNKDLNQVEGQINDPSLIWNTNESLYIMFLGDHNRNYDAAFGAEMVVGAGMVALCAGSIVAAIGTAGGMGLTATAAGITCAKALVVGATAFTLMATVKESWLMGLNVVNGKGAIDWCGENR